MKIIPYDDRSPEILQSVEQFVANVLPYEVEIEHVGSTSFKGLGGKGIVDILIVTERKQQLSETADILRSNGFSHNPDPKHA